jgi:hypothetical protein
LLLPVNRVILILPGKREMPVVSGNFRFIIGSKLQLLYSNL